LVLGLTLAELLLLLLFVLLLVLGRKVQQSEQKIADFTGAMDALKPIQEALANNPDGPKSVAELVQRLARAQQLEKAVSQLKEENAALTSQMSVVKSLGSDAQKKLGQVAEAVDRASKIEPNNPPAALKRALDVLDKIGTGTNPDQVKPLSDMVADANLKESYASLQADRETIRQQRDNLMRSGNGLTLPSCWTLPNGQTEFMFDVTTRDGGLIVKDATPARSNDPAWKHVDPFPRNALINESVFTQSTKRLFAHSNQNRCRFYTILRDGTGVQSKERYKGLRRTVEGHFYISLQNGPVAAERSKPQPATGPKPSSPGITLGIPWLTDKPQAMP
jgi:hypothetical protein